MRKVRNGAAELTKFGPSDIFLAHEKYGLEPVVSENYGGDVGNNYYAVAVVRKSMCDANPDMTLSDLKGKRACHTGYRRTAGWTIPVGFLIENNIIPVVNEDAGINADAESVVSFFSKTCAPGTREDGPTSKANRVWDPLCTACGDDCSDDEKYAGYPGTIRGLMEDSCDVAFTKQEVALQITSDGTDPEAWSTLSKDDLRLVCPNGGCDTVENWRSCNLAAIPSQAFVGNVELLRSEDGKNIKQALVDAGNSNAFLVAARDIDNTEDHLITSNTKALDVRPNCFTLDPLQFSECCQAQKRVLLCRASQRTNRSLTTWAKELWMHIEVKTS